MESKAKVAGHPVHPMLVAFPLGLLGTAAIFDGIQKATGNERWSEAAHYMMAAGLIGGAAAAVPGLIDYLEIPEKTRAHNIGLLHGIGNAAVLGIFAASWAMRRQNPGRPSGAAMALSFGGMALSMVTGWLGGELVDRLGVGVDDGANLNAPNSLAGRAAHEWTPDRLPSDRLTA
ncbi:MAG: rane protein [Acidobacteriaceae bacterium]|nr:rane protein [Acidobacteriaceae bacterium]